MGGTGRSGPSCVLPQGVPQGQLESGGIVLAVICWSPSAQKRCNPTGRCAYRPSLLDFVMRLPFDFDRIPVDRSIKMTRVKLFSFPKFVRGPQPNNGPSMYQTIFILQRIDAGNTSIQQNLAPGYFSRRRDGTNRQVRVTVCVVFLLIIIGKISTSSACAW